ncbi:dynein heavy chain 1, axonemal-like [Fopius arisanus]|uniref:Dynein heavy chain 1, axonemal-like n=1 Tax=Fopius arisanus TaxID=64838 RepID=A0A9R1SU18_9HYME|nr:PREDICTED: dynein heavy chain 1, axonemal-like [Fopius arisanus]
MEVEDFPGISVHQQDVIIFSASRQGQLKFPEDQIESITKNFVHWSTLYVLPEIYDAARCINELSKKLNSMCLFSLDRGKVLPLKEFEAQQIQSTLTVIKYIREEWVDRIIQSVTMQFRDIGKGAFDLRQKTPHVYDVIKLPRFINMMTLRMQKIIIERLDDALLLCHNVKQPCATLLPGLTFPPELYLSSIGLLDNAVCAIRGKLSQAYEKAVLPLQAYAKEFNKYQEFHLMEPEKYIALIEKEENATAAIQEKIAFHRAAQSEIENTVPDKIIIGPFIIKVARLRNVLTEKHKNLSVRLLTLLTDKLKMQLDDFMFEYSEIRRKLREDPKSIEEIFETREYIENLPLRISTLSDDVNRLKIGYEVLESFKWNVPDEDFHTKWQCIGYPRVINQQIIETNDYLSECVEKFSKVELDDETTLSERIIIVTGNVVELLRQTDGDKVHENAVDARRIWKALKSCQEQSLLLNERRRLFGMPPNDTNSRLNELERQFEPYKTLWCTASDWLKVEEIWMDNPLATIDADEMDSLVTEMQKAVTKCNKMFQDQPNMLSVAVDIGWKIESFKPYVGLVKSLRNPGLEAKHLEEINSRTGIKVVLTPPSNLKGLLDLGIMDFKDTIAEVSDKATQEYTIGSALDKMIAEWASVKMDILIYKETGTCIMKVSDEILILLEEHIQGTQQIGYGPYRAIFEKRMDEWEGKLKLIQDVLMQWIKVQKAWMYLEPIFTSEDISRQLPMEARKYNAMDRNWRRIMKKAQESPIILRTCPDKTLLGSLKECENLLEIVQRGLSNYLEAKRSAFPRFYFLSDDELLEILAQTKNVRAVQPHLNKCFENMRELRFEENSLITRMYSADGEEVELKYPVNPVGHVEVWLGQVEQAMQNTLKCIIGESVNNSITEGYEEWVYLWPGQVVICADQIIWTAQVENAINSNSLTEYYRVMLAQLDTLRDLIRKMPTQIQRLMLESLITIQVHARDVVARLIEKKVGSMGDFNWNSQMRYYSEDSDVKIRVVNAEFFYGYEYLGNNGRLVITPLTERCYLTLTGALHLKFGGAPSGPAGTGKTETTKDLAKAFAIQCVVFNCSDQLDYISMGKFFKGLASAGAWACFDEFNRIDIEVLSVIAQQILTIQQAQQMRSSRFIFEGCDISLKPMCAVFITMNPGYAGRTELPDNLKALFRPVAMMVPNYALIAEISLFSYGFSEAKILAVKLTMTFKLSSEQLSTQDHYDFGMRAVKTVIAYAGNLKRQPGDLDEFKICVRALRDVNVPKFFKDDLKLFEGILSDLFPGLEALEANHDLLETQISETIRNQGLMEIPEQVLKVIQLYETTTVRHGLMLVGPTGTGKTKCYQILQDACKMLQGQVENSGCTFETVETFVLNPKAITLGQLYGEFDVDTHEWTDGILPYMVRAGSSLNDIKKKWYIFDGPVDAVWIENMNTVLDDNKKLCLTSGEIIKLSPRQTIMFEVGDLRVASPATVSRCGMIYLECGTVTHEAIIECWIESLPPVITMQEFAVELSELTYQLLPSALTILRTQLREIVTTVNVMMVQAYINLINLRFSPELSGEGDLLTPWAAFAIVWSVGASCDSENRWAFSEWLRTIQKNYNHRTQFPDDGLVYDYTLQEGFIDPSTQNYISPRWVKWTHVIETEAPPVLTQFHDIDVPTMDSIRASTIIGYLLVNKLNVLAVGPTGSGKTVTISRKLSRHMPAKFITDFIIFSAKTSSRKTQDLIDSKLEKRRTGCYGPPVSKRHLFFIDDLNMPMLEQYGAQPPLELLRQFLDFKGWYDTSEIGEFREICDVNIIGAMQPPGGGRNSISERVIRHFHIIVFPEMEDEAKRKIYGTIMKSWLVRGPLSIELLDGILNATLSLYNAVSQNFLPTPDKSHYTFNLRDFSRIFQGVLLAEPEKIDLYCVILQTSEKLLSLWFHEVSRVMGDRLINETDLQRFSVVLRLTLNENFGEISARGLFDGNPVLFGDFCGRYREYQRIIDYQEMESVFLQNLEEYNATNNSPMNLVLFGEAMSHLCRISRILRQTRGNALLLGMGGSGRQSLTRLSAFLGEHMCFQIESKRSYSINDWHDDIKSVMLKAGLSRRSIVFLFSDTQIKDESYLEDIHNILNSGDVPNIYQKDEMEKIYSDMRVEVQEAGLSLNRTNLFNSYLKNVRNNLHTVIAMSPIGDDFRRRLRQFPALVNCCTIDWFHPWSEKALQSVAVRFIGDIQDDQVTGEALDSIVATCQFMHSSTIEASQKYFQVLNRHNYVTPVSYLEMLSNYGNLLYARKKSLTMEMSRLSTGLNKLSVTESEVKEMQVTLAEMKPELEKATVATSEMIDRIREDTVEAEKTKSLAEEQQKEAAKLKRENEAIRNEANMELSQVKPMLQAAEASLKALNKGDITEVKAMKRPPVGVVLVIEAMCIVQDVKPLKIPGRRPGEKILDYWTPGSQLLSDAGHFLRELESFDKSRITEDMINKLKPYIENPSFHPSKIIQASKACHSLCLWMHAMYNWYFVNLKVEPKMEALKNAEASLLETERQLNMAMEELRQVEEGIQRLEDVLHMEIDKKTKLEREEQLCGERMSRAVRLINGLADEQKRWITAIGDIMILYNNAVGDILISCGGIAYLTPFTDDYRRDLLNSWTRNLESISLSDDHSAVAVLGDPVEIQQWHINGLPRDSFSVENVILSRNANRWPLFIDPQRQVNKWIKKTEKNAGLLIARMTDRDLVRVVETCVKFGRPCLIENVQCELESTIDSVLMKNVFSYGGQLSIKIGDNVVPYNDQFRLYLTTKLPNPHYPPEISVKVLLVNFALTKSGLLDQMLSLAVLQERPELEAVRRDIIISCADMKRDLKDIENKILDKLSKSEGSAVDDIDLIVTLESSKLKSEEIKIKVSSAEATQADIDQTRSAYLPVANRAQILYFAICDLKTIDFMYQYSLEWFTNIYTESIINTEKSNEIEERINMINNELTFSTYSNVCRSLFEKHKLHFAFLICIRILIDADSVITDEWRHLLSGGTPPQQSTNPAPQWLPERSWQELQALNILQEFKDFTELFRNRLPDFKILYDSKEPESEKELDSLTKTDFHKLLVIKSLRPDRLIPAIQLFVNKYLGRQFIESQSIQLSNILQESHPRTPIVFILSSGTDPAAELYVLAEGEGMKKRFFTISLGQGQGPRAESILRQSLEVGNWVFFQNCHLAPSWMPRLDALIESFPDNVHQDFRLFLTSTPTLNFPPTILENSMKLTVEPPRGIKANMYRVYKTQIPQLQELFTAEGVKVKELKSLLYSLCLFHSILLERRKYGSLGFNIPYEFSDGDLAICISQLQMFIMEYTEIPFEVLIYTAGHVNYGGRITDDWDRRCVLTLLQDFYSSEVLGEDYRFDIKGLYPQVPTSHPELCTYDSYLNSIMQLPLNDEPEIFGLHYNAELSYATSEGYYCTNNLAALQPRSTEGSAGGEAAIRTIADNLMDKVPELFDVKIIQERHPVLYEESLNTVLQLETKRYNALMKIVSSSLGQLIAALKGEIVMNDMLETMASNLNMNNVPEQWKSRGYPSLKPLGAWMSDLIERIQFMKNWSERGMPASFWISGFFFPQALFTGVLQNFARKHSLPVDTIDFSYQVLKNSPQSPEKDGCCLYGLFLEGCRWDGNTLEESLPKVLHSDMKPIMLLPGRIKKSPAQGVYNCPVYKTLTRSGTLSTTGHSTNFVLCMEIPSSRVETHWIKRGVALICALDY